MKKIIIAASLLTACVAFANPYAKCSACHGVNGEKAALGKSKIIKETSMVQQTSYIYIEGNSFEIYPDGNSAEPELMLLQGSLSGDKMGNFLPLDYEPIVD